MNIINPYAKNAVSSNRRKRPRPVEGNETPGKNDVHNNNNKNNTNAADTVKQGPPQQKNTAASASALIISASDKAGMDGIDRTRIDQIILRESGNSLFMQQQKRRDAKVNERIQILKDKVSNASPSSYAMTSALQSQIQDYIIQQPTRSTKVVVDMDMFYMACELLSRPLLKDVPACVGRGMILTSNYKARRYGVRSAMPGYIGDKLVQELSKGRERLMHVQSNFALYKEKSNQVLQVLRQYDPHLKSYSLDEAYLDIGTYLVLYLQLSKQYTDHDKLHQVIQTSVKQQQEQPTNTNNYMNILMLEYSSTQCQQAAIEIVHHLRSKVQEATGGLTCSAGVAPNVGLAKIASDQNKPNGQLFVEPTCVQAFFHPLAIRKIPGIGRVTEKMLNQVCDIWTVKDLSNKQALVHWLFSPATATFLVKASVGCLGSTSTSTSTSDGMDKEDADPEESSEGQKGMSRERTFAPESDWSQLEAKLQEVSDILSNDLQKKHIFAHTITVKAKLHTYDVLSKAKTLGRHVYIHQGPEIYAVAEELLWAIKQELLAKNTPIVVSGPSGEFSCRLLGIRCSGLLHEDSLGPKPMDKFVVKTASNTEKDKGKIVMEHKQPPPALFNSGKSQKDDGDIPIPQSNGVAGKEEKIETKEERNRCPLCNIEIVGGNDVLNRHIDSCLNGATVRQMVREESSSSRSDTRMKKNRLADYFAKH